MKFDPIFEKNASDMVGFLRMEKKTIPDKDVNAVFCVRYKEKLQVFEYSKLLSMLENMKLLDTEKSVNSETNFYQNMHKKLEESVNDLDFAIKYEKWPWEGYSKGHYSYVLYRGGKPVAGISNDSKDPENVIVRHIESKEKGMATRLIFMVLDSGTTISTGKPGFNSASTSAYFLNKKLVKEIEKNKKYRVTVLGLANNSGKEEEPGYEEVSGKNTKSDNYHYKFEKI